MRAVGILILMLTLHLVGGAGADSNETSNTDLVKAGFGEAQQNGVAETWVRHFPETSDGEAAAAALALDDVGHIHVTGSSFEPSSTSLSGLAVAYMTLKYNSDGDQQWVRFFDGPGDQDVARAIAVDASSNVYVTGESGDVTPGLTDYATVKYDRDGVEQWVARFNGANDKDDARAIAVDAAGRVLVTGESEFPTGPTDYATLQYNRDGVEQWVARFDRNRFDEAVAIAVDTSGNVYVTGESKGTANDTDFVTIKYNREGVEQWIAIFNGQANLADEAVAIAVDAAGNVYVTGESQTSLRTSDYVTIKYSRDGVEQWVATFTGTENLENEPRDMAVDGSGNVYVTGTTNVDFSDPSRADYATVKYNSAGEQQWAATFDGPVHDRDEAVALAVVNAGNVYVTGSSVGQGTSSDYATLQYNSAGDEQWVVRFDEANGSDVAVDIAVDESGNVFVTGSTETENGSRRITTIQYTP